MLELVQTLLIHIYLRKTRVSTNFAHSYLPEEKIEYTKMAYKHIILNLERPNLQPKMQARMTNRVICLKILRNILKYPSIVFSCW